MRCRQELLWKQLHDPANLFTVCALHVQEHALDTFHDIGVKQAEETAGVASPPCALPAPTVSPAADDQTTPTDLMPQPQQQHNLQQNLQQTASTPSPLPLPSEDMQIISKQTLPRPDSPGRHKSSTPANFTFAPPAQPSRVQRPSALLPVQPSTPVVATQRQPSPPPGHQIAMDKRQPNPPAGRQLDAMSVGAQKTGAAATSKSAPQQAMLQQPRYVQHVTQASALAKAKEILGRMPQVPPLLIMSSLLSVSVLLLLQDACPDLPCRKVRRSRADFFLAHIFLMFMQYSVVYSDSVNIRQVIRMPTPPRQVLSRSEQQSSPLTTSATRHNPALADMPPLISTTAAGYRSQSPLAGNRYFAFAFRLFLQDVF